MLLGGFMMFIFARYEYCLEFTTENSNDLQWSSWEVIGCGCENSLMFTEANYLIVVSEINAFRV